MGGSKMPYVHEINVEAGGMSSLSIANTNIHEHVPTEAPIVSSYNDCIRPLLDTVDRLRNLNVMQEGIQLPTIVVVGDQSSGKSSVLESLAGISLPRGQGICTRVPLVMRLQRSPSPEPEIWLEFNDKRVDTDEEHVAEAISITTEAIAGSGKGVSDTPLTLHVKKDGVPDLTMVDLPGITRVPVNGQPENIYEQISGMIMKYIEPQESIILNVLSATVDFTTCESIRMSRQVDKTGERTLAVVTKADMAPEGLLELNKLPMVMTSSQEALMTLMNIIGSAKECLQRILVQGDFNDYQDDQSMHSTARLADMLGQFSNNLQAEPEDESEFLMDEIKVLEECKYIGLPNFIPRFAFLAILSQRIDAIHTKPVKFITETWDYIEGVLLSVLSKHSDNFPQIQSSIKRAGRNLISKIKEQSVNRVIEIVEMEKLTDYTCNPEYMTVYTQKIAAQEGFASAVPNWNYSLTVPGFGEVTISHLRKYDAQLLRQAFDMKVRITAYWTIVVRRIVDNLALYLQFSVKNLVNNQFHKEIVAELVNPSGGGEVEKMLEESPSMTSKREKLKNSIKLLKESKEAVSAIVDQISG